MKSVSSVGIWMRSAACLLAIQLAHASTPPPVPGAYQGLYNNLNAALTNFNTTLNGVWNGSTYPVLYGGNLANASASSGGPNLPTSGGYTLELQQMQAMGIKAMVVQVGFPMLYQPFFNYVAAQPGYSSVNYNQFLTYYQQVAQAVRAAGMKLIVDTEVMLSSDVSAAWSPVLGQYYATLNWTDYQTARAQAALAVAQIMQPDYLVLLQEPDSEATQTGQTNVNTVSGAASLLNQTLTALQPMRGSMMVGAGLENSLIGFQGFAQSFVGINCSTSQPCVNPPGLDFLDMQIFPMNNLGGSLNFQQNALTIAGIAASAGKPLSMSQAWLWKIRNSEWNVLPFDTMRARDPFSFWEPLDSLFIQLMENFANYSQMLFMAPDGPNYFFAYEPYSSSTSSMSPSQILTAELSAAGQANQTGTFSPTGVSYYNSLVVPPDVTPPSTPTILTASSGSSTTASLSWTASTDNIGVTVYHVTRNGVLVFTSAIAMFQDSGLTGNTAYTYQVTALDLAGNASPPATVTITTQNVSAPNPPTNVAAVPLSCQEVTVSWTPSSGSVPPNSYLLFEGTSPSTMVQVQQLNVAYSSFNVYHLTPGTTYYFGMEAKANNNLVSPMSNIAVVTTLAPPNAPTNVSAAANSATKVTVTWSPSTGGGMPIANYRVYRGTSPSSLSQVSTRSVTSYTDLSVSPLTTYYYAVQAVDTGQDISPMSATVSVTTP
jgi:fibronectin type 3 domain-containing protein